MRQYYVQSEEAKQLSRGSLGVNGLEVTSNDSATLRPNNTKRSAVIERHIDRLYKANLMNVCSALFGLASLTVSFMLLFAGHSKYNVSQA